MVITDGNDNSSILSLEHIMKSAHQSDVLIYGVGLLTEEEHREAARAKRALNDLAEATGGKTFFPKDVEEVDAHRAPGGARHPQPVHHRILALEFGDGRHLPGDPDHRQGSGQSHRAHAQRLLRHAGREDQQVTKVMIRILWRLSRGYRLLPVAKSVPALAHRDLLGTARGRDHVRSILEFRLAPAARTAALPTLGRAHELGAREFEKALSGAHGRLTGSTRNRRRPSIL